MAGDQFLRATLGPFGPRCKDNIARLTNVQSFRVPLEMTRPVVDSCRRNSRRAHRACNFVRSSNGTIRQIAQLTFSRRDKPNEIPFLQLELRPDWLHPN